MLVLSVNLHFYKVLLYNKIMYYVHELVQNKVTGEDSLSYRSALFSLKI